MPPYDSAQSLTCKMTLQSTGMIQPEKLENPKQPKKPEKRGHTYERNQSRATPNARRNPAAHFGYLLQKSFHVRLFPYPHR